MIQLYEPPARWKGKSQFVYIPADDPKRMQVTIGNAKKKVEDESKRPPSQRTKKHDRFTYTQGVDD
jgi:hypothetical protein